MKNKVQVKIFILTSLLVAVITLGIIIRKQIDDLRINLLHNSRTIEESQLLEKIYNLLDKTLESFVFDYTYWDEMYSFVSKPTDKWAKENIDEVLPRFNVQAAWVTDSTGKIIYTYNHSGNIAFNYLPFDDNVFRFIASKNHFSHFYLQTTHGLMQIRTAPIQPSADFKRVTKPKGFYIVGRLWSAEYLAEFSNILSGKVTLIPANHEFIASREKNRKNLDIVSEKTLYSWDKKPIAVIHSIKPSGSLIEMSEMNESQYNRNIVFLFAIVLTVIFFLYIFISKPLYLISKSLRNFDSSLIKKYLDKKNEFGEIANLITDSIKQRESLNLEIEERSNAEKRYRTLFENNPMPMWIYDLNTLRFLEVNDAAITHYGYSREEFLDMTIKEIRPADDIVMLEKNLAGQRQPVERSGIWRHMKKDGTIIYVEILSHELKNIASADARYVLVNDLTEKILAEEETKKVLFQLQQKEKLASLGLLVAGVAHEINNPNSIIKFNMCYIKQYFDEIFPILDDYNEKHKDFKIGRIDYSRFKDDVRDLLDDMDEGSDRITNIVTDLKNFAKIDQESVQQEFSLSETIKTTLRLLNVQIKIKKAAISFTGGEFVISTSQQKMGQIILNILSNSIDAVEFSTGVIKILLERNNTGDLLLTVEDNGAGIKKEDIDKVFDPFYTTKAKTGGTGLGLSVSKGLVESMGFSINIESEVGNGTKVVLTIPSSNIK